MAEPVKIGLDPVANEQSRVVILGTLPGDESLKAQQYYANPGNQFWLILGAVYGCDVGTSYADRLRFLSSRQLALWDVFASAERKGSGDSSIRNPQPNDFASFFVEYPIARVVVFNGNKPASYFRRHILPILSPDVAETLRLVDPLPSTSPTPGKYVLPIAKKVERWMTLKTV